MERPDPVKGNGSSVRIDARGKLCEELNGRAVRCDLEYLIALSDINKSGLMLPLTESGVDIQQTFLETRGAWKTRSEHALYSFISHLEDRRVPVMVDLEYSV